MTQRENSLIQQVLDNQESMREKVDTIDNNITSIHRAVYGDPQNKVIGLLDRQDEDEEIHKKILADIRPVVAVHKFIWNKKFLLGVLTALGAVVGIAIQLGYIIL